LAEGVLDLDQTEELEILYLRDNETAAANLYVTRWFHSGGLSKEAQKQNWQLDLLPITACVICGVLSPIPEFPFRIYALFALIHPVSEFSDSNWFAECHAADLLSTFQFGL